MRGRVRIVGDVEHDGRLPGQHLEASRQLDDGEPLAHRLLADRQPLAERFEGGDYYLSELIYAADIFKRAGAPLQEGLKSTAQKTLGTLVLGTVKNDIHDFGKDIVATVMSSNGLKVVDLGVNVEHQAFVDAIKEHKAELVGMSCLLTTVFEDMKDAIQIIKDAGLRDQVKIMIGGAIMDASAAKYTGADAHGLDVMTGVSLARSWIQ